MVIQIYFFSVLQKTLDELKMQQVRYTKLLEHREKVLQEQASAEAVLESRLFYEENRIRRSFDGRGESSVNLVS